ncbi:hypothetical protein J27TS7_43030 [Paenibacillus dendritiformis]|nr:hypothetical protein J27TS7_43030 [Paenibacillus dendritiformis]
MENKFIYIALQVLGTDSVKRIIQPPACLPECLIQRAISAHPKILIDNGDTRSGARLDVIGNKLFGARTVQAFFDNMLLVNQRHLELRKLPFRNDGFSND